MKVSILIPSLRPDRLEQCIKSINNSNIGYDYEILTDCQPGGVYPAVSRMFDKSQGEYIVHIPDDCTPQPGWVDRMIPLLEDRVCVGGFRTFNEYYGIQKHNPCSYYGKPFAAFICIKKDLASRLGGLIDSRYKAFYGDPDLSMRVYEAGGDVIFPDSYDIQYSNSHDLVRDNNIKEFFKQDEEEFIKRWGKF